ncbi:MAG: hypothetical protein LBR91_00740 [Puniceicoccales bacterium]|jgi:hypothetical protein|nr:hypothetical protein [Puniceicoccales bacterium]
MFFSGKMTINTGISSSNIVVLLDKSIPVQRRTNEKFMLVWKNNMFFSGKMTIVVFS